MSLRRRLKIAAHRRGLLASPTLAFQGVPFGRRDLAGEVLADVYRRHEARLATVQIRPGEAPGAFDFWCSQCDQWLPAEMQYGSAEREARECGLDHRGEEHPAAA